MDSFVSAGVRGGWTDYDIHTLKGIPKGAVVEIIATNALVATEDYVGVRTDGSGVDRRLLLHEAEGGGYVTARFLATVDALTGFIEYYDSDYGKKSSSIQTYYIVGYWQDIDFTETWIDLNVIKADESMWVDRNIFSSDSIPKGSVCLASLVNRAAGNKYKIGVRIDGSSLERKVYAIHEAEGGGVDALSMFVKTSVADGIIEIWCEDESPDCSVIIQGYFGSDMDFQELYTRKAVTISHVWQEFDLTGDLDQDGRVVDFLLTHRALALLYLIGARGGDSSLNRYINAHEAEDGGDTGFGMSVQSNADGVVDLYSISYAGETFRLTGYFKFEIPIVAPTVTTQAATGIGFDSVHATLNGTIADTGGENCDERGFDWDVDSGEPYGNSWTETDSYGTGAFSHQVTGLPEDITIYFRAKAHNSEGWGYGAEESFVTTPKKGASSSIIPLMTGMGLI